MAEFPILYPAILAVLLIFGGIIFSQEIVSWRLSKQTRRPNFKIAQNGATIHAPPNIKGRVMSISRYALDAEKNLIEILDDSNGDVIEIIAGKNNIKPYTVEGSLLNKDKMVWICNVDENGVVWEKYMGVDFMSSALNEHIALL